MVKSGRPKSYGVNPQTFHPHNVSQNTARRKLKMVSSRKIYKAEAMDVFELSEEDLSFLVAEKTSIPHPEYSHMPAYLYQRDETNLLARAVHGDLDTYFENREAKAVARLVKKQERTALLITALNVYGFDINRVDDYERRCNSYIQNGQGDPNQIAIEFDEKRFYKRHTQFKSYRGRCDYDPEKAKKLSLEEWVRRFPSREAALADPKLPNSLKDKVRQISMNK
jgi:hypothetical protein